MEEIGKEALLKLIEFIESASPHLWAIAKRQVMVDLVLEAILGVTLMVTVIIFAIVLVKFQRKCDWDEMEVAGAYFIFILIVVLPIARVVVSVGNVASRLINPDYYAIKTLMSMLTGG